MPGTDTHIFILFFYISYSSVNSHRHQKVRENCRSSVISNGPVENPTSKPNERKQDILLGILSSRRLPGLKNGQISDEKK